MDNVVKVMDGFVKDADGKFHIVPMKLPENMKLPSATKNSEEKRSAVRRKFIPIEPLRFTPADFESPQHVEKKRKIERPVCKELFKVPQIKLGSRLSSNNRQSVTPRFSSNKLKKNSVKNTKLNNKKKCIQNENYALRDIAEDEELSKKNSVKTVLFSPTDQTEESFSAVKNGSTPLLKIRSNNETTPKSSESLMAELEFLELEKTLASAKKTKKNETVSPMTSVCALLECTKITNSGQKITNKDDVLSDVLVLVKDDLKKWEGLKQQFENYQQEHEKSMSKIIELLENGKENKENVRRSLRLATHNETNKFITSPALAQNVDLRKKTLNKNLSKTLQYESPRTRKAVDMYNTMRNDCTVLCTPKLDRTNIDLLEASARKSLSRRIQKQCLLLQDTPRPS